MKTMEVDGPQVRWEYYFHRFADENSGERWTLLTFGVLLPTLRR